MDIYLFLLLLCMINETTTKYVSPEVEIVYVESSQTFLSNTEHIECDPDTDLCPEFHY